MEGKRKGVSNCTVESKEGEKGPDQRVGRRKAKSADMKEGYRRPSAQRWRERKKGRARAEGDPKNQTTGGAGVD